MTVDDASRRIRVTVDLTPKAADAMNRAAALTNNTPSGAINQALQVFDELTVHMAAGRRVLLADPDGTTREVTWRPVEKTDTD